MAARLTKRQADGACDAIKTGKIIKVLQDHVIGTQKLESTQVQCAKILLAKTLPDQRDSHVELSVDDTMAEILKVAGKGPRFEPG